jgi:serine phosphatase RsbU (regulator of sigma subunit)/pSer/pThr/pTyr-binding forkhead associated (FHA) protein
VQEDQGDYLELASPGEPPRNIPLTKARVLLGRVVGSDIKLSGGYVSRRHARLERGRNGNWRVIDLGSSNGTFVNGRRVQVSALGHGDVVAIGTYRLSLHAPRVPRSETSVASPEDTQQEIVPSSAASVVVQPSDIAPERLVRASLLTEAQEAGRRLSRCRSIESLLGELAREFHTILRPQRIAVGREDGESCTWPVVIDRNGRPAPREDLSRLLVPRVDALRSSLVVSWNELEAASSGTTAARANARSLLFPISVAGHRLGHVYIEFVEDDAQARDEAIDLLSLLARQVGLLWENLELQAGRAAAEELNRELSAARDIQLHLFPEQSRLDPRVDIAAENFPALGVSGDYYDYQLLDSGRVVFILADVMGHGLSAALLMASVQAVFRTGVHAGWSLHELDKHIHHAVEAAGKGETFVTGLLGLCDLPRGEICLLTAGHQWPSLWCGDQPAGPADEACLPAWGVFLDRAPAPFIQPIETDQWSLVAFTDGLPESPTAGGGPYGTERLLETHRRLLTRPADEICEQILSDVIGASDDSAPQEDDMTLLVLRNKVSPSRAGGPLLPSAKAGLPTPRPWKSPRA